MQTAGRRRRREGGRGGTLGSVRPLRDATLHLQHFGPSVEFVGFRAVLYVLEEQNTAGLLLNQTRRAKVKVWLFQTGRDTETLELNVRNRSQLGLG